MMASARAAMILGLVTALHVTRARASGAEESTDSARAAAAVETEEKDGARDWSAAGSVNIYIVPDAPTYAQPTVAGEYRNVHFEARYNYEALDTGSAWLGYTFSTGEDLWLELTPMVGGVFGDTTGIAPGYELGVGFWKVDLYSEGEYLFDTDDSSGSFAYTWSELGLSPLEWVRLGMVVQRTRAYETDLEVQRGILLGLSYEWAGVTGGVAAYVFDLGQTEQIYVVGIGAEF